MLLVRQPVKALQVLLVRQPVMALQVLLVRQLVTVPQVLLVRQLVTELLVTVLQGQSPVKLAQEHVLVTERKGFQNHSWHHMNF